jgi:dUTP pyrophosphatase
MTRRGVRSAMTVRVTVKRLPHGEDLPLPTYQSDGAAGLDLLAAVPARRPVVIAPGAWATVPTGIAIALPAGTEGQVRPRSGLAARHGISVLNAPGTIDSDYRGELQIILVNLGRRRFQIERGMRIAQLVITPVLRAQFFENRVLDQTSRGDQGFGSTGERSIDKRRKHRP